MRVFRTSVPRDLVWAKCLSLCSCFFQWQEPRLPRATEVWQAKDLEGVTFRDRTNLVVDFGCIKEHRLRSKRPKGTTMDGLIFPGSMSDVHTLQDSNLYGFLRPKAGVLHVTVKSWDLCQKLRLKFQTLDIHKPLWTGPVAGSSIFVPTMVTSLVTWSHLAKSLVRCQCLETALGNMEGLKLSFCCREIQKIDWTAWQVHSEWFTWNHMKENWNKSMNSENSDLTCVLISLFQFRSVAPLRVNCSMTEAKWILRKSISDFHRMCQCLLLFD